MSLRLSGIWHRWVYEAAEPSSCLASVADPLGLGFCHVLGARRECPLDSTLPHVPARCDDYSRTLRAAESDLRTMKPWQWVAVIAAMYLAIVAVVLLGSLEQLK